MALVYHIQAFFTIITRMEICLLPSSDQLIIFHQLQNDLCKLLSSWNVCLPLHPLCIKSGNLKSGKEKIQQLAVASLVFKEDSVFLQIKMTVNQEESLGQMDLCTFYRQKEECPTSLQDSCRSLAAEKLSSIKKISPFKIAEIEFQNAEKGKSWKVREIKWEKISK